MSISSPMVSVVIPTRQRPLLVRRAVESALGQTYAPIEVVVVVDGEDAETVEELRSIGDGRLRILAFPEAAGGSEARNRGIQAARGEWIALLDDDDIWFESKLKIQMRAALEEKGDLVLITCRRINWEPGQPDEVAPWRVIRSGEDPGEYLFRPSGGRRPTSGPQTSGYLATRKLFRSVPFTPGLKCHQDWDWYLRAMSYPSTRARMIEQPLYRMYKEQARASMTRTANWELSLAWANNCRRFLTARAYVAFLIHDCMYRCEVGQGRGKVFRTLLVACRRSGDLSIADKLSALKWYIFRPSVRLRLRGLTRRTRLWLGRLTKESKAVHSFAAHAEAEG